MPRDGLGRGYRVYLGTEEAGLDCRREMRSWKLGIKGMSDSVG